MRKFITTALTAAALVGTLGMASSASAQDWAPRHGWEARHWDHDYRDGGYRDGGYRYDGYREAQRDWRWHHDQDRHYWDARHDDHRRWDRY